MVTLENEIPPMLTITFSQVIAGVLLFIALLNGEYLLALLLLFLLVLVAGTKIWSRNSLVRMHFDSSVNVCRLFPGDRCTYNFRVQNTGWLPVWLNIDVSSDGALQPIDDTTSDLLLSKESSLMWYQQGHFSWKIKAERRGVYHVGAQNVRAGDLFGFFPQQQRIDDAQQIFVYPRLIALQPFPRARQDIWGVPGTIHPIKDPVYLFGTRDYQYSQPAKHIHWKASARICRLQEKLFESTSREKVLLMLDVDRFAEDSAGEPFERTIEVVASLGLQMLAQGQTVGLITNGKMTAGGAQILPLSHSRYHPQALLELLAQVSMDPCETLYAGLQREVNLLRDVSCVHFSYCYDQSLLAVEKMIRHRDLPAVFVTYRPVSKGNGKEQMHGEVNHHRLEEIYTGETLSGS